MVTQSQESKYTQKTIPVIFFTSISLLGVFAGIMSGETALVGRALAWLGWRVQVVSAATCAVLDFNSAEGTQGVVQWASKADGVAGAIDYSTLSRGRQPGRPCQQKPLRSSAYPLGLPSLQGESKSLVEETNRLLDLQCACARVVASSMGPVFFESFENSILWHLPAVKVLE